METSARLSSAGGWSMRSGDQRSAHGPRAVTSLYWLLVYRLVTARHAYGTGPRRPHSSSHRGNGRRPPSGTSSRPRGLLGEPGERSDTSSEAGRASDSERSVRLRRRGDGGPEVERGRSQSKRDDDQGRVSLHRGRRTAIDDPKSQRTVPVVQVQPGTTALLRALKARQAADMLALGVGSTRRRAWC
jgi:hypothetical protein